MHQATQRTDPIPQLPGTEIRAITPRDVLGGAVRSAWSEQHHRTWRTRKETYLRLSHKTRDAPCTS